MLNLSSVKEGRFFFVFKKDYDQPWHFNIEPGDKTTKIIRLLAIKRHQSRNSLKFAASKF